MIVPGIVGGLFIYAGCLLLGASHDQAWGVTVIYAGMKIWSTADKR